MKKIYLIILIGIFATFNNQTTSAEWMGPLNIKSFEWGNKENQIGFESGDPEDYFPSIIYAGQDGNILLPDGLNKRVYILQQNGSIINCIGTDKIRLINNLMPFIIGDIGKTILFRLKDDYMLYDYSGNLIKSFVGIPAYSSSSVYISGKQIFILGRNDQKYYEYNVEGQLVKSYDTKPLALGVVQEQSLNNKKHKVTVTYPDKTYEMIQEYGACPGYKRDACGNLYCGTTRFDSDGKEIASFNIPERKDQKIERGKGLESIINVLEEYGEPVLSPLGDMYTWKRTPDKYGIIKWVWVDGLECPQYLEVKPTTNSLKFNWQKPTKDTDTVTGYQLLQSYNICGPFRQTALIKKDQLSYEDQDVEKGATLYYVVKAIRGKEYSGNSNKVCGQIE